MINRCRAVRRCVLDRLCVFYCFLLLLFFLLLSSAIVSIVFLYREVDFWTFHSIRNIFGTYLNFVHFRHWLSVPRQLLFLHLNISLDRWHKTLFGTYFGLFVAFLDQTLSYLEICTLMGKWPLWGYFGHSFHDLTFRSFLFYGYILADLWPNMGSGELQWVLCPSILFWWCVKLALDEDGSWS